ncbi:UNVERIFIED_CONTAM: hypothetical protein HHA_273980 [Hammondia hammondi]|eukprot:XP_008882700.1 hypothetical protein HHA_273980 [Hammondia hammondi]
MKLSKKLVVALCCTAGVVLNAAARESAGESAAVGVATGDSHSFEDPEVGDSVEEGSEELQVPIPQSRRSSALQSKKGQHKGARLGRTAAILAALIAALSGGYYMMNKDDGEAEESVDGQSPKAVADAQKKATGAPEEAAKPGSAADQRRLRIFRHTLAGLGGTAAIAAIVAGVYQLMQHDGNFSDLINSAFGTGDFDPMNGTSAPSWATGDSA